MTKNTSMRLHRILNIILSVLIFISGACLIAGCLYIYFGEGAYTRELVQKVFSKIAIPVYITLAVMVANFVYELVSPAKAKKEKPSTKAELLSYSFAFLKPDMLRFQYLLLLDLLLFSELLYT